MVKELSVFGVLFIFLSLIILRETNPNLITVLNTLLSGVCALIGSIIGGNYALKAVEKSWQLSSGAESENKLKNLIIRLKLSISALDSVKDGKCSMIDACIADHEILNEAIIAKLEKKEKELETARENVANLDGSSSSLNDKLLKYNTLLGYTDVIGQGIIITLDDGDAAGLKGLGASSYIVHDGDIREIINELKNAGAEAISVNGQRITARTAVSCIGNVVKINDQKVGAPFVIKAIGPTTMLYGAMTRAGGYAEILEIDYGVKVKIERVEKEIIEIPKYEGVYEQNYASNVE